MQARDVGFGGGDLLLGQRRHLGVVQQFTRGREVALALLVAVEHRDDRLRPRLFAAQFAQALHVGGDARIGERRIELGQAQREALELLTQGVFHRAGGT